jgi:hypothetical protein
MSADHELLLEWVSEHGSGTWEQFRKVNEWLFPSTGLGRTTKPGATANALSILGHLEVDWDAGEWAVAPPVLTVLPFAGAHATLVGCRTRHLKKRLEEYTEAHSYVYVEVHPQLEAPDAIFVATDEERHAQDMASYLEMHYDFSVADRLCGMLPTFDSYLSVTTHSVPTRGFGVKRFDGMALQWNESTTDSLPGLYKYEAYGRPEYRFVQSAPTFLAVDLPLGVYAELRRIGRRVLVFEEEELNGTLVVPARAPMPWLPARCAAMCSGLEPSLERTTWTRRYVNVPRPTAERIAKSLAQELVVKETRSGPGQPEQTGGPTRRRPEHLRFAE